MTSVCSPSWNIYDTHIYTTEIISLHIYKRNNISMEFSSCDVICKVTKVIKSTE